MTFARIVIALVVLLSLGGCFINQHLAAMHIDSNSMPGWFASACTSDENPALDCKAVLKSKWAVFPFKEADPLTGAQPGVPVALLGWFYFTGVALWFGLVGRPRGSGAYWHWVPVITVTIGCCVSGFFLYVMFTELEYKCVWCITAHALNFAILIGTFLLLPRDHESVPAPESGTPPNAAAPHALDPLPAPLAETNRGSAVAGHPGLRLVCATGLAILGFVFAEFKVMTNANASRLVRMYKFEVDRIKADTTSQIAVFEGRERAEINVRDDDPRRGLDVPGIKVIVFSDFQCPACRTFADSFERNVQPSFGNRLRLVWKHYPLCTACNDKARRNLHPAACRLAQAAEAARIQGGSDAFFRAHDLFFSAGYFNSKRTPEDVDFVAIAKQLNLDPDQFVADANSEAVAARIAADVEQARELGVKSTPTIYFQNRQVERYMLLNAEFMRYYKNAFDYEMARRSKEKAPAATSPADAPASAEKTDKETNGATPGTPDPPGAD